MSTAVATEKKAAEPLFSKKNRKLLTDPFNDNNPVTVQILGVCSALAVTSTIKNALVMAICVTLVTGLSNFVIALIRNGIPSRIRMIVQLVVIAFLVSLVAIVLKAYMFDLSKQLAVYIGLIITNCIVMGRLEAYAMANKPWPSFLDGIGNGLGYGLILVVVAFIRELFGSGKLFGFHVLPDFVYNHGYMNNGIMVLPLSSIFLIGIFIWVQRSWNKKLVDIS